MVTSNIVQSVPVYYNFHTEKALIYKLKVFTQSHIPIV